MQLHQEEDEWKTAFITGQNLFQATCHELPVKMETELSDIELRRHQNRGYTLLLVDPTHNMVIDLFRSYQSYYDIINYSLELFSTFSTSS